MSWFWRGFQSAIFYYVSCAPCSKLSYRRKRRIQNRRAKADKAIVEEAIPDIYQHPSPFSTNIHWHEEIALGPGPPPKKGNRDRGKTSSSREINTRGQGSSAGASSLDTSTAVGSSDKLEEEYDMIGLQTWNTRRYQRPDEILWGMRVEDDGAEVSSTAMGGTGRTLAAANETYYIHRNPAVNDLHPPVVSTYPTRKNETKWMLQPPPSAKIMEGKERTTRSRSVSGGSRRSMTALSLGRQVSERLIEEKVKRFQLPPTTEKEEVKEYKNTAATNYVQGQSHDRDARPSTDSKLTTKSANEERSSPINISKAAGNDSHSTDKFFPQIPQTMANLRAYPLYTPVSSVDKSSQAMSVADNVNSEHSEETDKVPPHLLPPLVTTISTSSFHIL